MSSTTPERRTDPNDPGNPGNPGNTDRFRPFGSSTPSSKPSPMPSPGPTTATPVSREDPRAAGPGAPPAAQWEDPEDTGPARTRHVVDRLDGAVGLFVLRIVTAVILAIRGLQKLQHLDVTRAQFTQIGIPYPDTMAVVVGSCEFAIAFALIIGLVVRVAGLGIAIITIGALIYVRWRTGDVFTAGQPGFNGELELLLAGVGVALMGLGGGGWGVDRRFRRR